MTAGGFVILTYHDKGMGKMQLYKGAEKQEFISIWKYKYQITNTLHFCICPA